MVAGAKIGTLVATRAAREERRPLGRTDLNAEGPGGVAAGAPWPQRLKVFSASVALLTRAPSGALMSFAAAT
jgi:hypothetical protein